MSESLSSTPTLPEMSPWISGLLPDGYIGPVPDTVPVVQQSYFGPQVMPQPQAIFVPQSADEHLPSESVGPFRTPLTPGDFPPTRRTPALLSPSPCYRPYPARPVSYYRSYSPCRPYGYHEEVDDHFVRRWQRRDQHNKQWVPDMYRSPSPMSAGGIHDYFYLNVRSVSEGGEFLLFVYCVAGILNGFVEKSSLVFSDFSSVLDSFLRTVFVHVEYDKPLEYPIHRLFQKIEVLRSRLDDARSVLDAEKIPEDLASKAEAFGSNECSDCEVVVLYLTNLVTHLRKLLEVVEAECKQTVKQFQESLSNNQISFDLLGYYYEEGARYIYNSGIYQNGVDIARQIVLVVLKSARFSDDREELTFEMEYLEWDGVHFEKRTMTHHLQAYQGTREISYLFLQPITDDALAKLTGENFTNNRVCHAEYYDDTPMRAFFSDNVKPRARRVMIDPVGFHRARSQGYNPKLRVSLPDNAEEHAARLPYWIGGYDLEMNVWRTFNIWDLKPVEYDQEAWRKLVMDDNTKDLIKALVDDTGCSTGSANIAQLKTGKVVLLNGSPGTGRMTTVHAVCNLLKRPLLPISVCDLPFHTMDFVSNISRRMSLATTWNAVVVVKDADVFLKSLGQGPYMNCVNAGLRQFESDDCISFWVTSTCDKELRRRFSAVIDFPELDTAARRRLWLGHFGQDDPAGGLRNIERTLIGSSFVDQKKIDYSTHLRDIEKLSWYQLDGSTIENIVRSARALAASNGEHLSTHHVKVVMDAQRLNNLPLWRKLSRFLILPAKVLHSSVVN
ncbi:uncharacterized protein EDB91DRAFT_1297653 [Suillus paluster]|uniref:uncharacterized protein n=1 Tax=Suillus paluster TaxID=48578 RepID=UPI001B87EF6F|nr:uncharacterized protein EDB91DRAFT_1297653 [Suillus paluster]KAG1751270.1 hypothetical protein EDB91DRAFT_1297653 [Suillus paluster]